MNFPPFNSKELSTGRIYDLSDPAERRSYFYDKLGKEIEEIKQYLEKNSFLGFLVAKKSAGKGTYSKMVQEVLGSDRIATISVGDIVRETHKRLEADPDSIKELKDYLSKDYRGFLSPDDAIQALLNRSQDKLIPTEFILSLVKREIAKYGKKALFIDGLPRSMDQISYSLYFRDLINFRDDPDFFILIDVPESVIDERMKYRVVCPQCNTSRNIKLLPTKFVSFDKASQTFYLNCDNTECPGYKTQRLVEKEGDKAGIEPLRGRLNTDAQLMEMAVSLYGVPKIMLRNSIPVSEASSYVEDYELTPEFSYKDSGNGNIETTQKPWIIKDDNGAESYSLMAPPVTLSFFHQMHQILLG